MHHNQTKKETAKIYQLCKTVETMANLSAPRLLMPLNFREPVLLYSLTGCRLALTDLSGSPHCSCKTPKHWARRENWK